MLRINPDNPLEPNPSQPPLDRGGAERALPLTRGSWRGFMAVGQPGEILDLRLIDFVDGKSLMDNLGLMQISSGQ